MDFTGISTKALEIVLPFLKSKIEKVNIKTLPEDVNSALSDTWKWVKRFFITSEKDEKLIQKLEENPSDVKLQGAVENKISEKLEEKPEYYKELENILKNIELKFPSITKTNTINNQGNDNQIFQDINNSNISIGKNNVNNYGNIEKQVNNPKIDGNFQM